MTDKLLVEVEDGIARVLFNRPDLYNAIDGDIIESLAYHMTVMATDPAIKAVVISGAGKAFSSGADLKNVAQSPEGVLLTIYRLAGILHNSIVEIRKIPKPVIAAVNGVAAGAGFSTALACDFRIMAKSATLRQVYTSWGLCIDAGGTFALPRLVGLAKAMEIAAFDQPISAEQALAWGLATKVVDDGQALDEAMAMARELSQHSLHSFGQVKNLLNKSYENPLEVQLERERNAITACVQHPDAAEGVMAFVQKRKPVFNKG